MNSVLASVPL